MDTGESPVMKHEYKTLIFLGVIMLSIGCACPGHTGLNLLCPSSFGRSGLILLLTVYTAKRFWQVIIWLPV